MSAQYQPLLPLCYEIEGLLCLINQRNGEVPSEMVALLSRKVETLNSGVAELVKKYDTPSDSEPRQEMAPGLPPTADSLEEEVELVEVTESVSESEPKPEPEYESVPEEQAISVPAAPRFQVASISINDRYLFCRELFNSDMQEMEDTLADLSQTSDIDEAIEYLSNDLCWDLERPVVKDFIIYLQSRLG